MMLDQDSELAKQQKEFERLLQKKEEDNIRAVEDLTAHYQSILREKEEDNIRAVEDLTAHYQSILREKEEDNIRAVEVLTAHYQSILREKATHLYQLLESKKQSSTNLEETQKQTGEETESEIRDLKRKYENRLRAEKEENQNLTGEAEFLKKQIKNLQQEMLEQREELKESNLEVTAQTHLIESLDRIIIGLKDETRQKDDIIKDKEYINADLKAQNEELTNVRFELDYKVLQLQNLLEPKENEIRKMNNKIKEMEHELEKVSKQNTGPNLSVEMLKQTLKAEDKGMQEEGQKENALIVRKRDNIHREPILTKPPIYRNQNRRNTKPVVTSTGVNESEGKEKDVKTFTDFNPGSTLSAPFCLPAIRQSTSKLASSCPIAQKHPREKTELANILQIRSLHKSGLKSRSGLNSHLCLPPIKQTTSKY